MHVEKRVRRSEFRSEALELLLESCRSRGGFDAMVIADERGLLVASSTAGAPDAVALASVIPSEEHRRSVPRLAAQSFGAHGQKLYLAGIGGRSSDALADAVRGAVRILA